MSDRTYKTEFPKENAIPEKLVSYLEGTGWTDESWHNDACPSFDKGNLKLWIEAEDHSSREMPNHSRFSLCNVDEDGSYTSDINSCESLDQCFPMLLRADDPALNWKFNKPEDIRRYGLFLAYLDLDYHIDDDVRDISWHGLINEEQIAVLEANSAAMWAAAEKMDINPWDQWPEMNELDAVRTLRGGFSQEDTYITDPFMSGCGRFEVDPLETYGDSVEPVEDSSPGCG